jgi:hypothetical protein
VHLALDKSKFAIETEDVAFSSAGREADIAYSI